jgi:hypothetical protein
LQQLAELAVLQQHQQPLADPATPLLLVLLLLLLLLVSPPMLAARVSAQPWRPVALLMLPLLLVVAHLQQVLLPLLVVVVHLQQVLLLLLVLVLYQLPSQRLCLLLPSVRHTPLDPCSWSQGWPAIQDSAAPKSALLT